MDIMATQKAKEAAQSTEFVSYLQTMVRLEILDDITRQLDEELEDSRQVLADMKKTFIFSPTQPAQNIDHDLLHEELTKEAPNLLLPDMVERNADVDLDGMIASIQEYAEEIKKSIVVSPPRPNISNDAMQSLDITEYAQSLDQLSKRLASMKLHTKQDGHRDLVLEDKLSQLCQDVNMVTQMIQTNTKLSETNENWKELQPKECTLGFEEVINKLLSGINEVTYLLQQRKRTDLQ